MAVPSRFAVEYPERALELIQLFEEAAHQRDLVGSFGLLAAAAVLTIPYERMRASHFLHDGDKDGDLAAQIGRLKKVKFLAAPFWFGEDAGAWRQARIMASIEDANAWRDERGRPSLSAEANTISRRTAEEVIRVLRNALAHGNIIYLDKDDREIAGRRMESMAFLSRYEESGEHRQNTYRVVVTTEGEVLRFIKAWARWVSSFPADTAVLVAA